MSESNTQDSRLIFIGGAPRSGTTLVQNMLDCHPLIVGGPEFLHLPDLIDVRKKLHASIAREWIDLFCSREDVDRHLITIIQHLFLSLADQHGCRFYSEKTPENILVFSDLVELLPQAHFIAVVRDPRAILSSMQQVKQRALSKGLKPPWFTVDIPTSVAYIRRCMDAGHRSGRLAPERVLTVVYERLVADPEGETRRICTHIGIEWDARVLRPGDQKHLGDKALTAKSDQLWYDKQTYRQNVTSQALEKWRQELSLLQQVYATMAFAGYKPIAAHGYDFSLSGLGQNRSHLSTVLVYGGYGAFTLLRWVRRLIHKIRPNNLSRRVK